MDLENRIYATPVELLSQLDEEKFSWEEFWPALYGNPRQFSKASGLSEYADKCLDPGWRNFSDFMISYFSEIFAFRKGDEELLEIAKKVIKTARRWKREDEGSMYVFSKAVDELIVKFTLRSERSESLWDFVKREEIEMDGRKLGIPMVECPEPYRVIVSRGYVQNRMFLFDAYECQGFEKDLKLVEQLLKERIEGVVSDFGTNANLVFRRKIQLMNGFLCLVKPLFEYFTQELEGSDALLCDLKDVVWRRWSQYILEKGILRREFLIKRVFLKEDKNPEIFNRPAIAFFDVVKNPEIFNRPAIAFFDVVYESDEVEDVAKEYKKRGSGILRPIVFFRYRNDEIGKELEKGLEILIQEP